MFYTTTSFLYAIGLIIFKKIYLDLNELFDIVIILNLGINFKFSWFFI